MEANKFECRQTWKEKAANKNDTVEDHDNEEEEASGGKKLAGISCSRGSDGGGSAVLASLCQAERCGVDLTDAKRYHRRHKVCEFHSKAPIVIVSGLPQRFCQQCSRFHELPEFDETKRSCRRRLAGHNERRRKSMAECNGEGSSRRGSRESDQKSNNGEGSSRRGSRESDQKSNNGEGSSRRGSRESDQKSRVQITHSGNSTYKHLHIR